MFKSTPYTLKCQNECHARLLPRWFHSSTKVISLSEQISTLWHWWVARGDTWDDGFMFSMQGRILEGTNITLFRFMTLFCGTDAIPHNIPIFFPHSVWMWEISRNITWNVVNPTKDCYRFEECYEWQVSCVYILVSLRKIYMSSLMIICHLCTHVVNLYTICNIDMHLIALSNTLMPRY